MYMKAAFRRPAPVRWSPLPNISGFILRTSAIISIWVN